MEKHECEKLVKPIILSQWAILCAINTRSTQYSNNNNYNKLSRMTGPNWTAAYFLTCAKINIHTLKKINMYNLKMIKNTVKQKKSIRKKHMKCDGTKRSKIVIRKRDHNKQDEKQRKTDRNKKHTSVLCFLCCCLCSFNIDEIFYVACSYLLKRDQKTTQCYAWKGIQRSSCSCLIKWLIFEAFFLQILCCVLVHLVSPPSNSHRALDVNIFSTISMQLKWIEMLTVWFLRLKFRATSTKDCVNLSENLANNNWNRLPFSEDN